MEKRRIINFRAFLMVALCVAVSVFCIYIFMLSHPAGIAAGVIYLCALALCGTIEFLRFKRGKTERKYTICIFFALALCILSFCTGVKYVSDREKAISGPCSVTGRVCVLDVRNGDYRVYIDSLNINGKRYSGKMELRILPSDKNIIDSVECGDMLSFNSYVKTFSLIKRGKVDGSSYRTDVRYSAILDPQNISVSFGNPKPLEKFSLSLRKLLTDNMDEKYGNIAFSMLTGDKYMLYSGISDTYSAAGLGHIMAVSGLHVGFMTALLSFLLKRIGRRTRFAVISAVLIAYTVLANFSPSVVRAVIMAEISMCSVFVAGRRDILSSLCCSFSLILAFKPLYLFEVGFLLSFGAILGIAMFSSAISRFLNGHKIHRKVSDAIGSATSVQLGIAPAQIYFFNSVQPLAILVNIIVLPYISVVFIAIVCCSIIGAIPVFAPVLVVCKYLLVPVDAVARGVSSIGASATVFASAGVFLCYFAMFMASDYIMAPFRAKLSVALASVLACAGFIFVGYGPVDNAIVVVDSKSTESVVITDGKTYVIGNIYDPASIYETVSRCMRGHVDGVFMLVSDDKSVDGVTLLAAYTDVRSVYVYDFDDNAIKLVDSGLSVYLADAGSAFVPAYAAGDFIGYERGGILFASDSAQWRAFDVYDVVRTHTINKSNISDGITYLCNESDVISNSIYTLESGPYTYSLRSVSD